MTTPDKHDKHGKHDKKALIELLQGYLEEELQEVKRSDGAESERATELSRQILMYRFLPVRDLGPEDVVCPAALVELELQTDAPPALRSLYFVTPRSGGLVTRFEGQPVQVVSPQSPIGEALLGRKVGDTIEVAVRDGVRRYRVVAIQ